MMTVNKRLLWVVAGDHLPPAETEEGDVAGSP